jgi:hypothetical protein
MNVNHLLLWMSARQQGSWIQFKSAVEELLLPSIELDNRQNETVEQDTAPGLPYHQLIRLNLESMAHAEFFARETNKGWRIVPPSLAIHRQNEQWVGVLCGARSHRLLSQITEPLPASAEVHPLTGHPDQILLTAPNQELLIESAKKLNLLTQLDAPIALLLSLLPVTHLVYRRSVQLPFGKNWKIDRFSTSSLNWEGSSYEQVRNSKGDLFHFSLGFQHQYLYCYNQESFDMDPRVGKFLSLARRHRHVVRYEMTTSTFLVPASLRPPKLIERAFTLSTGLPACYDLDNGLLIYQNIPVNIAQYAATLLSQELN